MEWRRAEKGPIKKPETVGALIDSALLNSTQLPERALRYQLLRGLADKGVELFFPSNGSGGPVSWINLHLIRVRKKPFSYACQ